MSRKPLKSPQTLLKPIGVGGSNFQPPSPPSLAGSTGLDSAQKTPWESFVCAKLSFAPKRYDYPMYAVYILISEKDRRLYIGYTNDLKRRLHEHFSGKSTATKHRLPLKLIYFESYQKWSDAKRRETYLKGGNGKKQLKIQLQDTLREFGYKHL